METTPAVVGRFAPSPTSDLHLGNLRTALLAWLFARAPFGSFVLRLEDLDRTRVAAAPGVADGQLRDLEALGLDWDGPVLRQSGRFEVYRTAAAGLPTYECFCTRREISEAAQAPQGQSERPYPGTCLRRSPDELTRLRQLRSPAIRVRAEDASFTVHDRHAGPVTARIDDFVLFRNDGMPAYNLAVVVDDAAQGVTQVTRGDDLLSSAPRQGWLASRLSSPMMGQAEPEYIHVGLALNPQGHRLAKRDGAVGLRQLRALGHDTVDVLHMITDSLAWPRVGDTGELLAAVRAGRLLDSPLIWQPWVVHPPTSRR